MSAKRALVTGGSKGIGQAICRRLAQMGYGLVVVYWGDTEQALAFSDELLTAYGVEVYLLEQDVSDLASIPVLLDFLDGQGLTLDVVVMNAGITDRTPFDEMTIEGWDRVFTANVHYPTFLLQQLGERLVEHASVVFTGSKMGIEPHAMNLSYGVTKSAVHALVRNLVKFFAHRGIRVNGVAPGFVMTEWQREKPQAIVQSICSKVAMGRFAEPEEIADAFMFLIQNSYVNGEILTVDGGYSYK